MYVWNRWKKLKKLISITEFNIVPFFKFFNFQISFENLFDNEKRPSFKNVIVFWVKRTIIYLVFRSNIKDIKCVFVRNFISPFYATLILLYPIKTSENQRFLDIFKGCRKRSLAWNRLTYHPFEEEHKKLSKAFLLFSIYFYEQN